MWRWLTVFGLAATPALILGPSGAWVAGLRWGMNVWALGVVIVLGGFLEGLLLVKIAEIPTHMTRFQRWLGKWSDPTTSNVARRWKLVRWLAQKGPWPGVLVGSAFLGQEPLIIFFVWAGVPLRRLIAPIFVTNVLYTVLYAFVVKLGFYDWDQLSRL